MNSALAIISRPQQAISQGFSADQVDLIRKTLCPDATDNELALFLSQCQRTGLDPFSRQIYFIKRGGRGSTQISIDGFRVIAERSGEMDGQAVEWCGEDGAWTDVWLKKENPAAARVLVYRKGCAHSFPAIAKWSEYAQEGPMWKKMPANQLAKCAESLALRKAFPHQLSGLYTTDEMEQAGDTPLHEPLVVKAPKRIELPGSTFQIVSVHPTQWGADVTFVDPNGEEVTHKTTERQCAALCEQVAQEGVPVTLCLQAITRGKNAGKLKLIGVNRWTPENPGPAAPSNLDAIIDAEIAAKDSIL